MAVQAKQGIEIPDFTQIKTALISVSDKTGLKEFAEFLGKQGVHIRSTGGTAKLIASWGIAVQDVSDYTGFPETMDGRVKTLHPKVHGGLLGMRTDPDHAAAMQAHNITAIDLVVVNLYPFEEVRGSGADFNACVENIDIGGPAMIRAAAKNHGFVTVVVDPADYSKVQAQMEENAGAVDLTLRKACAAKAYSRTAVYDAGISAWFNEQIGETQPDFWAIGGVKKQPLRYGENPHQQATFYTTGEQRFGVSTIKQIQGKELSYNNINDTDAAYELLSELGTEKPTCVIVKHANPCGVATGSSLIDAYKKAFACDTVSAFGGIIAVNQKLDAKTAEEITQIFTEVIIAPDTDEAALEVLKAKKNLRLLLAGGLADPLSKGINVRTVAGGLLVQNRDNGHILLPDLKVVTKRQPTQQELQDLLFAFRVAKHVKSNAIIYAKDGATVGIGAGQMSRLDSSRIAACKAVEMAAHFELDESPAVGSVVASDAFFPFPDGLIAAAEAGVTAVIQPGGSIKDSDVIAAADERNLAMVFTGMRHFRH